MQIDEPAFSLGDVEFSKSNLASNESCESFKVKFGTGYAYRKIAPNSFSFHGKGEISVHNGTVSISGKRRRMFWFGVPEEHVFEQADIYDVRANGKYVRFDVHVSGGFGLRQVGFIAGNAQSAREIVAALPRQQTEAFATSQKERTGFHARLDALSPSAFVTPAIVGLNVLVFLLMALDGAGVLTPHAEVAIRWGTNFGPLTLDGQWWRLFTATFIHFGILHLAFNMLALYQSGRMVERIYGSVHFLLLYVFSGLAGSVVSLLWHPGVNSAGASGAIFGVFGALLAFMLNPKNAVPRAIMNEHRNSTIMFIAYNLLYGFGHAGIDNGAHIGGLLGGLAMGFMLSRPLEIAARARPASIRLILAGLAGALALGALSYPLVHPSEDAVQERRFSAALREFGKQESQVVADSNDLLGKIKKHTISSAVFADSMERNIVPQWQHMHDAVGDPKLDGKSRDYPIQQALLRYVNYRMTASKLFAFSARANDSSLLLQANESTRLAQLEIANINKLMAH